MIGDDYGDYELFDTFNSFYEYLLDDLDLCIDTFWNQTAQNEMLSVPIIQMGMKMEVRHPPENPENDMTATVHHPNRYNDRDGYRYRECDDNILSLEEDALQVFGIPTLICGVASLICCYLDIVILRLLGELQGLNPRGAAGGENGQG